jgi:hypothetical protein
MREFLKKRWLWLLAACILIIALILMLTQCGGPDAGMPTLTVETPQKLSKTETTEFTLDVTISDLGDALYPAMSMSIAFDASRLEFLGVEEGNVFVYDTENTTGRQLPQWSYDTASSNASGRINIMYLDLTGGKHAFSKGLLAEDDNVVLRLRFRLKGSVRRGDVMDLILDDAVFAASNENDSLAMNRNTLKARNGKIVIGE